MPHLHVMEWVTWGLYHSLNIPPCCHPPLSCLTHYYTHTHTHTRCSTQFRLPVLKLSAALRNLTEKHLAWREVDQNLQLVHLSRCEESQWKILTTWNQTWVIFFYEVAEHSTSQHKIQHRITTPFIFFSSPVWEIFQARRHTNALCRQVLELHIRILLCYILIPVGQKESLCLFQYQSLETCDVIRCGREP